MVNDNEEGANATPLEELLSESRRSASTALLCQGCGEALTGKKRRWCSDACRMADRRDENQRRRLELLDSISASVEQLRREVLR
jgi:hypothetical protein